MINPPGNWRSWRSWLSLRPWQRHSLVLTMGGLIYIGIGFSFFNIDSLTYEQSRSIAIALRMWSLNVWGFYFVMAGITAIVSSRWPQFSETWGYISLTGLSAAWSSIYILGYFLADGPNSNISAGLIWGMMAFMWWAVSGLQNPPHIRRTDL